MPIHDLEIKPTKEYLISNKQFEYEGHMINVVEKFDGHFRVVAIRSVRKGSPYLCFDVASDQREKGQKPLLIHRARLIAFVGLDPSKPIARHGKLGRRCHDLENLEWGTPLRHEYKCVEEGGL